MTTARASRFLSALLRTALSVCALAALAAYAKAAPDPKAILQKASSVIKGING